MRQGGKMRRQKIHFVLWWRETYKRRELQLVMTKLSLFFLKNTSCTPHFLSWYLFIRDINPDSSFLTVQLRQTSKKATTIVGQHKVGLLDINNLILLVTYIFSTRERYRRKLDKVIACPRIDSRIWPITSSSTWNINYFLIHSWDWTKKGWKSRCLLVKIWWPRTTQEQVTPTSLFLMEIKNLKQVYAKRIWIQFGRTSTIHCECLFCCQY